MIVNYTDFASDWDRVADTPTRIQQRGAIVNLYCIPKHFNNAFRHRMRLITPRYQLTPLKKTAAVLNFFVDFSMYIS